jgi:hypothetical protein
VVPPPDTAAAEPATAAGPSAERFARALDRLLHQPGADLEWSPAEVARRYDRLAATDPDLRLGGAAGKEVVAAVGVLARRGAAQVEAHVRKALHGLDPRLVNLACQQVREHLTGDDAAGR